MSAPARSVAAERPEEGAFSLLGRDVPAGLERRVVVLRAGATLHDGEGEWRRALVVLEHGEIELEAAGGRRLRLHEGAVLCLARLGPVAVRCVGPAPAVLAALGRRRGPPAGLAAAGADTAS